MAAANLILNSLTLVVAVAAVVLGVRRAQAQHRENLELQLEIETQVRRTRHAIRNLAAALNLRPVVRDLENGHDAEADDELASR